MNGTDERSNGLADALIATLGPSEGFGGWARNGLNTYVLIVQRH